MQEIKEIKDMGLMRDLYRQLFINSSDPLFILDKDFNINERNKAFDILFDTENGKKKMVLSDLFEKEKGYQEVMAILGHEKSVDEFEVKLKGPDSERIYALISLIEVSDGNGVIGHQGIVHDETERIHSQRQLVRAQRISLAGRMVGTIAHEIRNPLTNIHLALASISDSDHSDEDKYLLSVIESNSKRINDLLIELLDSSRPADLQLEVTTMQDLIRSTLAMTQDRMELMDVKLTLDFQEEQVPIRVDVIRMKLAINNILINAIEASGEGGEIHMAFRATNKLVRLSIHDKGVGMTQEVQDHLFDPFFTKKAQGTGLGLTSVQNILDTHGWNIEVESEVGEGTTFHLSVPLVDSPQ